MDLVLCGAGCASRTCCVTAQDLSKRRLERERGRAMTQGFGIFILALWLSAMLVGCGGTALSEQPADTPGVVVVTMRVADAEEYRIRLTDADDIATARK